MGVNPGDIQNRAMAAEWASVGVGSFDVSTSDSVNFTKVPRGFYIGGTGDVVLVNPDGTTATWKSCPVGLIIPCSAVRINATGTTAAFIVGIL